MGARAQFLAPVPLLYAGPALAGVLGTPDAAVWGFAALVLGHVALAGPAFLRTFRAGRRSGRVGLASLAAVMIALVIVVFFGAGDIAHGPAQTGDGPLWPLLVSAAALPLAWILRDTGETAAAHGPVAPFRSPDQLDGEAIQRQFERDVLAHVLDAADELIERTADADLSHVAVELAGLSIEPEVLDALTDRAEQPPFRLLRLDYLTRVGVFSGAIYSDTLCEVFASDLTTPVTRDRAAEIALRWANVRAWSQDQADRLSNAARIGPQSPATAHLIAALKETDD